jgi:hypothetical protein
MGQFGEGVQALLLLAGVLGFLLVMAAVVWAGLRVSRKKETGKDPGG